MKSVYIHIPFCYDICCYCDFAKVYYKEELASLYLDSLAKEIEDNYKGEPILTLYIGGGTPSALSLDLTKKLISILSVFDRSKLEEFTIECNVSDISEDKLKLWREFGVNRLSIGVESFQPRLLKLLNRRVEDATLKINLAKEYFDNISVDLMYGIHSQTINELKDDIKKVLELEVEHISTYSLILEEHTMLSIQQYPEMDEDFNAKMYEYVTSTLEQHGYEQYEFSNYSKKGYESKHNLVYWNNEEYYGFGLGASSYRNDVRATNTRNMTKYLKHDFVMESHLLEQRETMENEMILGLRKREGVKEEVFFKKYQKHIEDVFDIEEPLQKEYLIKKDGYLSINPKYYFISNEILISFMK